MQLEIDDVVFSYPENTVLRNVSFGVGKGDFVGILGPNGCGKSTLLNVVNAVLRPERGEVRYEGRDVLDYSRRQLARSIAVVPQNFNLDFEFTVQQVVEMGHYVRHDGDPHEEARRVLSQLHVEHLADRLFLNLSGGEKQMAVLGQALCQDPDLLLLDEPTSALDISHELEFFEQLGRLNADGLTVVIVLHDLNMALEYCRDLVMLSQGELVAGGPAGQVLTPENVGAVYGVSAHMHHDAGRSYLTFAPQLHAMPRETVHLICGGGTGCKLMVELTSAGFGVSAGAVNALDGDEETGRDMGIPLAVEAPFSDICEDVHEENLRLIDAADVVVLTDVPIGVGNMRNLDALRYARDRGKRTMTVAGIADRDYSGGRADVELEGVRELPSMEALLNELRGLPVPVRREALVHR